MDNGIKLILNNGHYTEEERGQLLIRSMTKAIEAIINYNYAKNHYAGDDSSAVMKDKLTSVKNGLSLLLSDMILYEEHFGIRELVDTKAQNRLQKMAERIIAREEERLGN